MKVTRNEDISYEVVRSQRSTTDIVVGRDGKVVVHAPATFPDERIENIVEAKRYWIYKTLAEWRDLDATRMLREYRNGEGFLYLGRSYRLLLMADQEEPVSLKGGRFCLRRDVVDRGDVAAAQAAFRDDYVLRGQERIRDRVNYYVPKFGVELKGMDVRELGYRWASCSPSGKLSFHWKCMMAPPKIID